MSDLMNIFKDGALVEVHVSFWSGARSLSPEDLGLKPEDVADAYKLGRKMLVPADVIKKFRRIEAAARRVVADGSFRFPIGNAQFIPRKKFEKILQELKLSQTQYLALVDELVENYDKYRTEMVEVYQKAAEKAYVNQLPDSATFGPEYDPEKERAQYTEAFLARINSYYPPAESLKSRFALWWDVFEIAIPRMKKTTGEGVLEDQTKQSIAEEEYRKEMQTKIASFMDDVVGTLRQETIEVCNRIAQSVKEGKVIHGKTLNSLKDFVDRFSDLNFVGDTQIEEQLQALRKEYLDIYPSSQVNKDEDIKAELGRRLKCLSEAAANMTDVNSITGQYKRKIMWHDSEPQVYDNASGTENA